jgi:hypothetical protein
MLEKEKFYHIAGEVRQFKGTGSHNRSFFQGSNDVLTVLRCGVDFDQEEINSIRPVSDELKEAILSDRQSFYDSKAKWVNRFGAH